MGNDGGTIASRSDILALAKKTPAAADTVHDVENANSWCTLSQTPLQNGPVVSDYKGHLFAKEKLLEFLLRKKYKTSAEFKHIRSLSDVRDVSVEFDGNIKCPVTNDAKISTVFAYSRRCGCVVSYSVLRDAHWCPKCTAAVQEGDIVVLNRSNDPQYAKLNATAYELVRSKGLSHSYSAAKKPKSKKRPHDATNNDPKKIKT